MLTFTIQSGSSSSVCILERLKKLGSGVSESRQQKGRLSCQRGATKSSLRPPHTWAVPGWRCSLLAWIFSLYLTVVNIPHRHAWGSASWLILNPVRLTTKISHLPGASASSCRGRALETRDGDSQAGSGYNSLKI